MITLEDIRIIEENYPARDHNNKKGDLGFGLIHYGLIKNLGQCRVLVVGSQKGFVPAICALACKETGGFVDFVDAGLELKDKGSWGGVGIWKRAGNEYWEPLAVEKHIKIHCTSSSGFVSGLERIPIVYGYIYIDGNHSYAGVKADYKRFWPFLREGGMMAFHDVMVDKVTDYGRCGVKRFWEWVSNKHRNCVTISTSAGLGIIQKGGGVE
jgi:hypothetical protein